MQFQIPIWPLKKTEQTLARMGVHQRVHYHKSLLILFRVPLSTLTRALALGLWQRRRCVARWLGASEAGSVVLPLA